MDNWYTHAIIALILMGTQSFLYKVSAERNCNTALTTLIAKLISKQLGL
jgi:hypothetical protein